MAPLPQNNTQRVFYDYVVSDEATVGTEHTFQVRGALGLSIGEIHQAVDEFLNAITPARFFTGWRIIRARHMEAAGVASFPTVLPPGLATFIGTGADPAFTRDLAVEATFQGRSFTTGRRVDVSLYGIPTLANTGAFRIEADNTFAQWVTDAVSALNNAGGAFCTIDGSSALYYPYVNWNFNSYWETRLRRG